jgi:hypothetical protein
VLNDTQKAQIKAAFDQGTLKIRSVSPEGNLEWQRVLHVQRNEVPWETIQEGCTALGDFVLTAGHRVFISPTEKLEMQEFSTGDCILTVRGEEVTYAMFRQRRELPSRQFMYDLTADQWHNFVLYRSGIVVSNSPDKFYHFRPPEHERNIGQYDRVFGQVWEDAELLEYLLTSLDWWNMYPPFTGHNIPNLDILVTDKPSWRTVVLWGAIVHACFALSVNWVHEEFDYSIGGVSLSIQRSDKYMSLMDNAKQQVTEGAEAKARTVKYIRGLQQPRFGIGIRSAFGPHVGRGVLSPRNFL